MNISEYMKNNLLLLDGGMGTCLQAMGLGAGVRSEQWNITHPDKVISVHKAYFDAGSNVVCANTFGANSLHYDDEELERIICAAMENVHAAQSATKGKQPTFAALDIGPLGRLFMPFGDLEFEQAVSIFAKTVRLGVKYGADLIFIETMNDAYETKAALLAAKENCELPVFVSNAYDAEGKLMTGATPQAMTALLEGMGADAIGANCSLGPKALLGVVDALCKSASVPVIFKPNAGLPVIKDGKTEFDIGPDEFALQIASAVKSGARIVGGCCGTTPEYIAAVKRAIEDITPCEVTEKGITVVSSYRHAVAFSGEAVLIGERINPTGKKKLKQALIENDIDYILDEAIEQKERGAHILDVNVGIPDIDEKIVLPNTVYELQAVCNLPLQIDTANIEAMEKALRIYNGKALINSVNGKSESMEAIFPLAKKYGGVIIALTLDESGIPDTVGGRIEIAKKILKKAAEYGIAKKDIIFDPLAMAVSADKNAAKVTLETVRRIKDELGCKTSLGVSNISFGLPERDTVNANFFAAALNCGLDAAIMNPYSVQMMKTYYAYRLLNGFDENCADYIKFCETVPSAETPSKAEIPAKVQEQKTADKFSPLAEAILSGKKESAAQIAKELLERKEPLDIINADIIPALDRVGKRFEKGKIFLPQLLMSAESAKAAFEMIKKAAKGSQTGGRATFILATVKGDIHDLGKNIVKLLLENYGFNVIDLGRDVPPETVAHKAKETRAQFVGLSALMTTTVPSMEETVRQLRIAVPQCKIVVGGAVLTEEYANKMGADKYAKDAMETVRYAIEFPADEKE